MPTAGLLNAVPEKPAGQPGVPARRRAAAALLGIDPRALDKRLENAKARLGAKTIEHAVALAYPVLHDRYLETAGRRWLHDRWTETAACV